MQKIIDNDGAFTIFDRIEFADKTGRKHVKPLQYGRCAETSKAFLPRIPLESTIKQRPDYRGFFVRAAMDASDNGLESVSFHVRTGRRYPFGARLAALVSVCTTRLNQSGKMVNHGI